MEENKDLINTVEETSEVATETAEVATETVETKEKKPGILSRIKAMKSRKIRNEALFKRGGISVAITAVALALLILLNVLVSVLSDRFHLEFDISSQKVSTISEENLKFIKDVENEVTITVCASEDNYLEYMNYYAQNYFSATPNSNYFEQTKKLVDKYGEYNDNIIVRYIDPQSTEFTELTNEYETIDFIPGDILVTGKVGTVDRHKKIGFAEIYEVTDESGYASYGYSYYTITGNKIETALTSAIAYATSTETKKVAFLTGHNTKDNTSGYRNLLSDNNYAVDTISDSVVSSISADYDLIAIVTPTIDFSSVEIDAISEFLHNGGQMGKGLIFFADAVNPALPNLYEFLVQWGIEIEEGIVFETDDSNHTSGDPTTLGTFALPTDVTNEMGQCVTAYNVPMVATDPADDAITVTTYFATQETAVKAPAGVSADWKGYTDNDKGQYAGVLESKMIGVDKDNNDVASYIMAFSSVEYVQSEWVSYSQLSNQDIALACTNIASGVEDVEITFTSKTITDESFSDAVTQGSVSLVIIVFMFIIPILTLAIGIYIYIRRRNA